MKHNYLGNVQTIKAQFGNFTVEDQAFCAFSFPAGFFNTPLSNSESVNVVDTSTFTSDIHQQGYDGLLGLGPNSGSVIRKKVGNSAADSFILRALQQTKATANYITFLLDRKSGPGQSLTGQFTINEVLNTFSNISSMPKLDVDKVNRLLKAGEW